MVDDAEVPEGTADLLLETLVTLTREGTIVAAFQAAHDKLRQCNRNCLRLAATAGSDERALDQLVQTWAAYAALFHEHHSAEEDYLFPALHRVDPGLGQVLDELDNQHEGLADSISVVSKCIKVLQSEAGQGETLDRLVVELRTLKTLVDQHLEYEEATTVPVIRTWSNWPR